MASFVPAPVFYGSDNLERSVWVVVEPLDLVTGRRVPVPLEVRLKDVAAEPIAARSGVYCFTDLRLPTGSYKAQVSVLKNDRSRYFDGEQDFVLAPIPITGQPLMRNRVAVELLPRSGYPFDAQSTLVRGRLVKTSDASPIANADIFLLPNSVVKRRGVTDERGEFVILFPATQPEDDPDAGLKDFSFKLQFKIDGHAPHETDTQQVKEGTTLSLKEIEFPGT